MHGGLASGRSSRPGAESGSAGPAFGRSKAKVARIYLGNPEGGWPLPKSKLNLEEEMRSYQPAFEAVADELAGVDFFVDRLVTSTGQLVVREQLKQADGVLSSS